MAEYVAAACDKASECRDALVVAIEEAQDAAELLAGALEGSTDPECEAALANIAEVARGSREVWRSLSEGMSTAQRVLDRLVGATASKPSSPTEVPPGRIEELRRQLPPPVVPGTGQKTHGRWFGPDARARPLISGEDEMYEEAIKAVSDLGLRRGTVNVAVDVETKLASYMRNHGIRSATLLINNVPCSTGRFTCDKLIPIILPEGCTLTVYGANGFRKTYRGGAPSPWRTR
ncbi:DddA-like double-stranded DNA deaminase toxin [Saccharothrix coeruleofusca]|uniref:DddA-like double-stranded DNA deaminase toxin n=1 Tax=Saccharothrix coeruleofusca TaxID=33919 RepID=UPI0016702C84|nr:DddA-like double-stranded DNA deaminase toxin [Saccharothrix coeruleofusca]